ncbi:hypothetical protein F4677DRAFT_437391 [Hypoxylon crocopeplum]|nr:hypothetical protein F4677DRAFT_437391 [Hypoxylon crocopeplum]
MVELGVSDTMTETLYHRLRALIPERETNHQQASLSRVYQDGISMEHRSSISHHIATPRSSGDTISRLSTDRTPFKAQGFADKESLAGWFPAINDDEKTSWRIRLSKRNRALLLQIALMTAVFITNLTLIIYVSSRYPSREGVGLIYAGDCDAVKTANRYLHLLINALSTGMLSASNYCIQLQASPTRADIDHVHQRGGWMDIGVPSLRNLRFIDRWRLVSCIVLALSSLPIHLLFNSAVFQSLASNDYTIAVVKDSFITGASWNLATAERNRWGDFGWNDSKVNPEQDYHGIILGMQNDTEHGLYEMKNVSDCYAFYDDYWAIQGNAVVLVKNETVQSDNDSLLLYVSVTPRWDNWGKNMWASSNGTGAFSATSPPPPVTTWLLGPPRYEVSHCLVQVPQATTNRCRLEYSTHISYTVIVLNFVKLFALFLVWQGRKTEERRRKARREELIAEEGNHQGHAMDLKEMTLSTLGDAIASFMREPDEMTKNMCLSTKYDVEIKIKAGTPSRKKKRERYIDPHPRVWEKKEHRWLSAPTWKQWFYLLLLYTVFLVTLSVVLKRFLDTGLRHRNIDPTFSYLQSLGFGAVSSLTYLVINLPRSDPVGLILNVLIINLPQLIFSFIYTLYGVVLTTFLVQREFSLLHTHAHRKPLRVSEPVGIQRSGYFISVPFRYGIPLMVFSALFHWLISQSFFLARITALMPDGVEDYGNSFSTLGYSPYAIIVTLIIGSVNIGFLLLIGCRKYDGTMRMVSTNSMAISAACHCPVGDREFGYQLPIQWGVVEIGEDGIGHCAFTTAPCHVIRRPQEHMLYQ